LLSILIDLKTFVEEINPDGASIFFRVIYKWEGEKWCDIDNENKFIAAGITYVFFN